MSYEKVIKKTKKIETILVGMGAEGQGLHQKVSSIEDMIDDEIVKSIRFIASVRNKLLHELDFEFTADLLHDFENTCENVIDNLKSNNSYTNTKEYNSKSSDNSSSSSSSDNSSSSSSSDNSSSSSSSDNSSGWGLLELGIVGAIVAFSWFNS